MKRLFLSLAALTLAAPVYAANARLAYQGTDGQYRSALVASPVCGVNTSGTPILCKGGTGNAYAYLNSVGKIYLSATACQ
ncbi:hypothetical protein [Acetobacter orientalis]|nr:hypothetical protein [Acetobacter orientalis]